ncbi:hypothetical protein B0H10DRAFT_1956222 [Mycena sp. CBHHK59/15]|nr:hypothetical protein B0H10DRAFT_1956222 [Mycena sp. CBHHK59/15]
MVLVSSFESDDLGLGRAQSAVLEDGQVHHPDQAAWPVLLRQLGPRESKTKTKLTRRAAKFLHVLKKWDETRWEELREEATQWQERTKRTASSSRGTSEAEDMEETEEEEELVVMSD